MPTAASRRGLLPWLSLLVVWLVWGSTYLAMRVVVSEMPPLVGAGTRFLTAGSLMALVALGVDRGRGWPRRRQWRDYALVGMLLLGVGNSLVMWSERIVPSGIAALIVATVPVWILLLDGLRQAGEPWTLRVWIGTAIGLGGVVLVARPGAGVDRGHWLAIGALQLATLSWTAGSLYAQQVRERLPLASAAAVEMLAGGALGLLASRLLGEDWSALATASPHAWAALGYLVVFGSLLGFTCFAYCLNELPASTVGTYAYVNPVVAVLLGLLVLREPASGGLLLGGALIVVSVVLTTLRPAVAGRRPPR
ncbi:MAG TPA: EamA family transporter [Vicinamibacteria bacterium]|nr:EamA family transporter [Vicinamibacteria bacterium]